MGQATVDYYLGVLYEPDLSAQRRRVVTKLLIEEEDKLGHDVEQLQFAESRATQGRERLNKLRQKVESEFMDDAQAKRLVANFEAIQRSLESHRDRLRAKLNSGPL